MFLLDRTSDASHNRSVFTVAGDHEPVSQALEEMVGRALDEIDMEEHTGEHPRIGAVDVVPFVPLADTPMDACVEMARTFGRRIAARWDLPVYLYAEAATRARTASSSPTSGAASTRASRSRSPTTAASRTSAPSGCTRAPARWPSGPGRS